MIGSISGYRPHRAPGAKHLSAAIYLTSSSTIPFFSLAAGKKQERLLSLSNSSRSHKSNLAYALIQNKLLKNSSVETCIILLKEKPSLNFRNP